MKKWKQLQLIFNDSQSEERRGKKIIRDTRFVKENDSLSYWTWVFTGFVQKCPVKKFDFWNVFKKGFQFDFSSIQVIESQLC